MTKRQGAIGISTALLASLTSLHCGQDSWQVSGQRQAIRVECAADSGNIDPDQWLCPERVALACSDLADASLLVSSPADQVCDPSVLRLTYPEPLLPGTHPIELRDDSDAVLCVSEAEVTRGTDLQLLPRSVKLWPPNHKLHTISAADCVEVVGACPGEEIEARFMWVSSDEPVDAQGDGHHEPDVTVTEDCSQLALRSERQGGSDGRVYSVGVRVIDGAGEAHETVCTVGVDHDQRGAAAVANGEAYRIDFDGTDGAPSCTDPDPQAQ